MSTKTEQLGLYKYDPVADAAKTFNISTALNDNWDKIDADSKSKDAALKGAIKFDAAQSLTDGQKTQARGNIGAADIETQNKIMAANITAVDITLSPAELPAYIAALPRLLDKHYSITLTAGICTTPLKINQFYGPGYIDITGASNFGSVFSAGVQTEKARVLIRLSGLSISGVISGATVTAHSNAYLYLESCTIDGTGASQAVELYEAASAAFNKCTIKDCLTGDAVLCGYNSIGVFIDCAMTNNGRGAYLYHGGIILLSGNTPELMGGSTNKKSGGIIVKADGTLL